MKKFLIILGTLVGVTVAAAAVFVMTFDTQSLKPYVEKAVYEATGRKLGIDGQFDVRLGLTPKIVMTKVTLENMAGADAPYMATADGINVSLALFPLLKKELEVKEFSLNGMSVNLYTDKQGRNNWGMSGSDDDDDADGAGKAAVGQGGKESFLKEIVIEKVDISDIGLSYIDARNGEMYQLFLKKLALSGDKNKTRLEVLANIMNRDISLTADAGALSKVLSAREDFDFSLEINGFDTSVTVKGIVRDALNVGTLQANVSAQTEKLQQVAALFGVVLPDLNNLSIGATVAGTLKNPSVSEYAVSLGDEKTFLASVTGSIESVSPLKNAVADIIVRADNPAALAAKGVTIAPFTLTAKAAASQDSYAITDIVFAGGNSDLTGNILASVGNKISVTADFKAEQISLDALVVPVPAGKTMPAVQTDTAFMKKAESPKVFSDEELPFDVLNKINATLGVQIGRLIAADKTDLKSVSFSAVMKDGVFNVPDFNLANLIHASAQLNAAQKPAAASVALKTKNLPLAMFFLQSGVSEGTADVTVNLKTTGNSVAQMAKDLNGDVFVFIKNPVFQSASLSNLKTVLPPSSEFKNKTSVHADCFVVNVPVVNGFIESNQQIALQADGFDVQVNGEVNLATEKVALNVVTGVTKADVLNALSGTLEVTGALKTPQLKFNAENVMNKALTAGMAYLFSGKKAAQQYLESPVPANACKLAINGGAPVTQGKKAQ